MKLLICIFIICGNINLFSQVVPTNQDCAGAIPLCGYFFNQTNSFTSTGAIPNEINPSNSCLGTGERNDVWYTFTVQPGGSGTLCFTISPLNATNDYDWAVYNLTNSACADIYNNPALEVSCNYSSTTGATGPNGLSGAQNELCLTVLPGETYVVNVSNFSASNQSGYQLDFTQSTANLADTVPPHMVSVTTPVICGSNQITANFDEGIKCSSVNPSAFVLTGSTGNSPIDSVKCVSGGDYSDQFIIYFSPPAGPLGNYSLTLNANSILDNCNNINTSIDVANFSLSPYTISASATPQYCTNQNGTAAVNMNSNGVPPFLYSWSNTGNTPTISGLAAGTYSVTVTDSVGCVSSASATVVTDNGANPPVASFSNITNTTCVGISDGSITAAASNGNSPYTFMWNSSPPQAGATATGLASGSYTVTVTDFDGCTSTAVATVGENNEIPLSVSPQDTSICQGGAATLTAKAGGNSGGFQYQWLNGMGTDSILVVSPLSTTTYSVFATDVNGCQSLTKSVTVTVFPLIELTSINPAPICTGDTVKLEVEAEGGNGIYNYLWQPGNLSGNPVYATPMNDTAYTVIVTNNCETPAKTSAIQVRVGKYPTFQFTTDKLKGCMPLDINFSVQPFISNYIYSWDFGDSFQINTQSSTTAHTYTEAGCKNVSLKVTSDMNCSSTIVHNCEINPFDVPKADFIYSPLNPSTASPIVTFSDRSADAVKWQWDSGDKNFSSEQNIQHEYADTGSYNVALVVTNDSGCTDTSEQILYVELATSIYLPNTFTPNNDDLNDTFGPVFEGIKPDSFTMYIFDRWSGIIYQTDDVNSPWNGIEKSGEFVRDGVYIYLVKYKTLGGIEKKIRGSVTLFK